MQIKILSVSEMTQYIKRILTNDPILYNLRVKGEISNCKLHSSGHMYFTLKDQQSRVNCVMFKSNCEKLKFQVKDGMKINLRGYISIYERDGQYQLYVNDMEPDGIGALYLAYMQLKEKLEKEGLFDPQYKKPIPYLPQKIALITSPTGAAIRDILTVIKRRFSKTHLLIMPVLVQGEGAKDSIVKAIQLANQMEDIDLIITGRGGGSIEELWAFNEESVARAIFNSEIPVISAVGHETDFTIADFVADLRAATPSAAAELAVPSIFELQEAISSTKRRLNNLMQWKIDAYERALTHIAKSYAFKYPLHRIYNHQQQLDTLFNQLVKYEKRQRNDKRTYLEGLGASLNNLSPLATLNRGYSVTSTPAGRIVRSVEDVAPEATLYVTLPDGKLECCVTNVLKEEKKLEEKEV